MKEILIGLTIFGFITLIPAFIFDSVVNIDKKSMVLKPTLIGWLIGVIVYLIFWSGVQTLIQTETYEEASNVEVHIIGGEYYVGFEFEGEQHLKSLSEFNVVKDDETKVVVKKVSGGSKYFINLVERVDYILYYNILY